MWPDEEKTLKPFKSIAEAKKGLRATKSGWSADTIWMAKAMPVMLDLLEKISKQKPKIIMTTPEPEKKEEKKHVSIDDVRCPVCDGVINKLWYDGMSQEYAIFAAECWSGDLNVEQPRHIFRFHIKLPEIIDYE